LTIITSRLHMLSILQVYSNVIRRQAMCK